RAACLTFLHPRLYEPPSVVRSVDSWSALVVKVEARPRCAFRRARHNLPGRGLQWLHTEVSHDRHAGLSLELAARSREVHLSGHGRPIRTARIADPGHAHI